jgi:hypothetical protein
VKPGDKGMAALGEAIATAEPGRYVIDRENAHIDVFVEILNDLVAGHLAARCPPGTVAAVLFRFGRMIEDKVAAEKHAAFVARQDAARRAVTLTETPAEGLVLPPRRQTVAAPVRYRRPPPGQPKGGQS